MDENQISVPCQIEGCNARISDGTRCHEHGGQPTHEWRETVWGITTWTVTQKEGATGNDHRV